MISFDNIRTEKDVSYVFLPGGCVADELSWHLEQANIKHEVHCLYRLNPNRAERSKRLFVRTSACSEYRIEEINEAVSIFSGYDEDMNSANGYYDIYSVRVLVSKLDATELTKIALQIWEGPSDLDYQNYQEEKQHDAMEDYLRFHAEINHCTKFPSIEVMDYESIVNKNITPEDARKIQYNAEQTSDVESKYYMGVIFENGYGLPKDSGRAYTWYRIAEKFGYEIDPEVFERFRIPDDDIYYEDFED